MIKPYKLQHLGPVVDARALMREHRSSEWSAVGRRKGSRLANGYTAPYDAVARAAV